MKQTCFLSAFIMLVLHAHAQTTFTLNLDKSINQEPQSIYLTGYDTRVSGYEFLIFDSVQVEKGQSKAMLSTDFPHDKSFHLFFSKNGPSALEIAARPGEHLEIDINEDTPIAGELRIKQGELNNKIIAFKEKEIMPLNQKISLFRTMKEAEGYNPKDSLQFYIRKQISRQLENLRQTDEGLIAFTIWGTITRYRKTELSEDRYQEMVTFIRNKFASNPTLKELAMPGRSKYTSPTSKAHSKRMDELYKAKDNITPKDTALNAYLTLVLPDKNGAMQSTDSLQSEFTLVDCWATWCMPCKKELPFIKAAVEKYKGALSVYFLSLDRDREQWKEYIEKNPMENSVHVIGIRKNGDRDRQVKELQINAIPRNFLLDKNHRIIAKDLKGEELMECLNQQIKRL